jgi:hypothetical protein
VYVCSIQQRKKCRAYQQYWRVPHTAAVLAETGMQTLCQHTCDACNALNSNPTLLLSTPTCTMLGRAMVLLLCYKHLHYLRYIPQTILNSADTYFQTHLHDVGASHGAAAVLQAPALLAIHPTNNT